jgi:YEATS domain-containing protein 4
LLECSAPCDAVRHLDVDKAPFEVTETGWGEFEIQIRITFVQDSGEKPLIMYHHLKLHPWTLDPTTHNQIPPYEEAVKAGPVHSWQYDEVVFIDPYQTFLNTLMAHPPTPLPKAKRTGRSVPFHSNHATQESLAASKEGVPEFVASMEPEEHERLANARRALVAEQDQWRTMLIEREKELERLKKRVAAMSH